MTVPISFLILVGIPPAIRTETKIFLYRRAAMPWRTRRALLLPQRAYPGLQVLVQGHTEPSRQCDRISSSHDTRLPHPPVCSRQEAPRRASDLPPGGSL